MYSNTPLSPAAADKLTSASRTTHTDKLASPQQPTFDLGAFLNETSAESSLYRSLQRHRNSQQSTSSREIGVHEAFREQQAMAKHILLRAMGGTGEGPHSDELLKEFLRNSYERVTIGHNKFTPNDFACMDEVAKFVKHTTEKAEALVASMRAASTGRGGR